MIVMMCEREMRIQKRSSGTATEITSLNKKPRLVLSIAVEIDLR